MENWESKLDSQESFGGKRKLNAKYFKEGSEKETKWWPNVPASIYSIGTLFLTLYFWELHTWTP